MIISALKERKDSEKRVAIVPDIAEKLIKDGHTVLIESNAGSESFFRDDLYKEVGAQILSLDDIVRKTDILLSIDLPSEEILSKLKNNSCLVGLLNPFDNISKFEGIKNKSMSVFSMELIPRISRAQSMDVLSSQANLAGYRAVITATSLYSKSMSMMMTAAGTVAPAKVFVMGVGVAGLQAIATAKRLGAIVEASDPRQAAKEEVLSLGAKFIEVDGAVEDQSAGGYAVKQSKEYLEKQKEEVSKRLKQADVVITTAQVFGAKSPILIPKSLVNEMKPGSVIIDLASSTGGNCELTKDSEIVEYNRVKIVGNSFLSSELSYDSSNLFSNNVFNFLSYIIKDDKIIEEDDEIINNCKI